MALKTTPFSALLLPGSLLDRYLIWGFLRIFAVTLAVATILYFIVDFFDRVDNLLQAGASLWTSARYFLFKLPLLISRVFGLALLFSTIFFLATLGRYHEIMAMRSSGISLRRLSFPLLLIGLVVCILSFFWNESLVPIFTGRSQDIYRTEVRKKQPQSLIGIRDIWLRSEGAFIRIDHFDSKRSLLEGVTIYLLNKDFSLRGIIEAPSAAWNSVRWETKGGREWGFLPDGRITQRQIEAFLPLKETPDDFKVLARDADEVGFFDLNKQIEDLKAKGIDSTEYEVDLQIKLALPLVAPLMVLLAIPFGLKQRPGGGIALSLGLTLLIGMGFWFLLAFSRSLGHSGALSPWVAAWIPNFTLALLGLLFSSFEEEI